MTPKPASETFTGHSVFHLCLARIVMTPNAATHFDAAWSKGDFTTLRMIALETIDGVYDETLCPAGVVLNTDQFVPLWDAVEGSNEDEVSRARQLLYVAGLGRAITDHAQTVANQCVLGSQVSLHRRHAWQLSGLMGAMFGCMTSMVASKILPREPIAKTMVLNARSFARAGEKP